MKGPGMIMGIILFIIFMSGSSAMSDYQGSDGSMHSGAIRLIIIIAVIYGIFQSPAGDVVKAAAGK